MLVWGSALAAATLVLLDEVRGAIAPAPDPNELNALSRMIRVELRGRGTLEEKIGMAQVALNRARQRGCSSLELVVTGQCGGAWSGTTAEYNRLLAAARVDATDVQAAQLALQGVDVVGPRVQFVHPGNANFNAPSEKRPIPDPSGRFVPLWSISTSWSAVSPLDGQTYRGRARYEPLRVGTTPTLFS